VRRSTPGVSIEGLQVPHLELRAVGTNVHGRVDELPSEIKKAVVVDADLRDNERPRAGRDLEAAQPDWLGPGRGHGQQMVVGTTMGMNSIRSEKRGLELGSGRFFSTVTTLRFAIVTRGVQVDVGLAHEPAAEVAVGDGAFEVAGGGDGEDDPLPVRADLAQRVHDGVFGVDDVRADALVDLHG
jgi:hypothetical protein